jgi:hypothetical protein
MQRGCASFKVALRGRMTDLEFFNIFATRTLVLHYDTFPVARNFPDEDVAFPPAARNLRTVSLSDRSTY